MVKTDAGWQLQVVDRGPDWLFVRLRPHDNSYDAAPDIAERLWSILDRHFIYRLVLEMDEVFQVPSHLLGQLVVLHKRILQHDGAFRLCGLTPECAQALQFCRLGMVFPNHLNRTDAVLGRATPKLPK